MQLQFPPEIDAHLTYVALDGIPVRLSSESFDVRGRLDLADSFGRVTFLTARGAAPRPDTEVLVEYEFEGTLWQFSTHMTTSNNARRWQLRRPRRITSAVTPRLAMAS